MPPGVQVELTDHQITLENGYRVGLTLGGRGVPLVFLHGAGLGHATYRRSLSTLPSLGFLVIGIDAPGHGASDPPPAARTDFVARSELVGEVLDELGVRRAVLVGHSMGGRTVIELAAHRPERALCAVLVNAAAGTPLDLRAAAGLASRGNLARQLAGAAWDSVHVGTGLSRRERAQYRALMRGQLLQIARRPSRVMVPMGVTMRARASLEPMERMRAAGVPTIVLGGERDLLVSMAASSDQARATGGTLYELRDAFHAWLVAHPRRFVAVMSYLADAELGGALRSAGVGPSAEVSADAAEAACLDPDARVHELASELRIHRALTGPPTGAGLLRHHTSATPFQSPVADSAGRDGEGGKAGSAPRNAGDEKPISAS